MLNPLVLEEERPETCCCRLDVGLRGVTSLHGPHHGLALGQRGDELVGGANGGQVLPTGQLAGQHPLGPVKELIKGHPPL